MCSRVAEINQHAVAHVFGDVAFEPRYHLGDGGVIGAQQLAHILRVETRGERRRTGQIAKHDCQLPALSAGFDVAGRRNVRRERLDRFEQPPAMTDGGDTDFPQILRRQAAEHFEIDIILAERRLVLF
jgi:hypothetical protein